MQSVVDAVMQRFFFPPAKRLSAIHPLLLPGTDPKDTPHVVPHCVMSTSLAIGKISVATLVIGSDKDPSTPWEGNGSLLARDIPRAEAVRLHTAHLSNLEQPSAFTTAVLIFCWDERELAFIAGTSDNLALPISWDLRGSLSRIFI